MDFNGYTKDLTTINPDLSSIFILDNSPAAYRSNPGGLVNQDNFHGGRELGWAYVPWGHVLT